jgi:hypothetical protein
MIGIEGSAPGKSSYLGNDHGVRAKSAKQSAFLAGKSIIGKKVGGRQVDLSGISSERHSYAGSYNGQRHPKFSAG